MMNSIFLAAFSANAAFADLTVNDLNSGDLVITELMHDPTQVFDYRGEWIEIYNNSGDTVDLNGLILSDLTGESISITSSVSVANGSYALLCARINSTQNGGMTNVDYQYPRNSFRLNPADAVILSNSNGTTIDSVTYNTTTTHPSSNGKSLNLSSLSADNSVSSNWCESSTTYGLGDSGTPGAANDSCGGLADLNAGDLIISEVMPDPQKVADYRGEWFEIYNTTSGSVNLNGLEIVGSNADAGDVIDSDIYLGPGEYAVLAARINSFDNGGISNVAFQYNRNDMKLFNNGDLVSIAFNGTTFDSVTYITTAVGGDFPVATGNSITLANASFSASDNDTGSNWCAGTSLYGDGDAGTPGVANDACSGIDGDGDGFTTDDGDCDDNNPDAYPGAPETCDGVDNDCDNDTNDGSDASTFYLDNDNDGFGDNSGDASVETQACSAPSGYVSDNTDCDDENPNTNPSAVEICDSQDNDCNISVDDNPTDGATYYVDNDNDGYGDENDSGTAYCSDPQDGTVTAAGDCDDNNSAVSPGESEQAGNGIDDNCDGEIDGLDTDADSDGFTPNQGDCDDGNASINPNASEVCDSVDNDCDNQIDENDATDATTWYTDSDADGYGDENDSGTTACDPISSTVADNTDCNDGSAAIAPGVQEDCSTADDDNCNGDTNDLGALNGSTFYVDGDGDGFGEESTTDTVSACTAPSGYSATQDDCNDSSANANPSASEICDSIDNDCDSLIDDDDDDVDVSTGSTYYLDADFDLWGDPDNSTQACTVPDGYRNNQGDCDDNNIQIKPTATEVCDGVDNNCDNEIDGDDDELSGGTTYYADSDGDGFGNSSNTDEACDSAPAGYVSDNTDCDDSLASTCPGCAENESNSTACMADADGDGYGADTASGNVTAGQDCNDGDASISPVGTETAADGIDSDCSGGETCFVDSDGDGAAGSTTGESTTLDCSEAGFGSSATDCDDSDANVQSTSTWFADTDGDDYGVATDTQESCNQPTGYASDSGDCNDGDNSINPGASETCNDGVDSDCDNVDNKSSCDFDWSGSSAMAATFTGESASNAFGYSVNHAGDLDGDGTPDVVMGARLNDSNGSVYVFSGATIAQQGGTIGAADAAAKLTGESGSSEAFGIDVAGGLSMTGYNIDGDINGDDVDDLIVGAFRNDDNGNDAGAAYIFYGPISGNINASSADATLLGGSANELFGRSLEMVGDVNGDNIGDFVVTAYKNDFKESDSGRAYLFYGSSTSPLSGETNVSLGSPPADVIFDTYFNNSRLGSDVGAVGDMDGDGQAEILVGAEFYDKYNVDGVGCDPNSGGCNNRDEGAAMVWYGSSLSSHRQFDFVNGNTNSLGASLIVLGEEDQDRAGTTVNGAGDFNGDGSNDILIGAPYHDVSGANEGAVYVVSGTATGIVDLSSSSDVLLKVVGVNTNDYLGRAVGTAGDLDGDGDFEVLMGAKTADQNGTNSGGSYLFLGGSGSSGTTSISAADAIFGGSTASEELGMSNVTVGDIDANGRPDFLMGAHKYSQQASNQGGAYLIFGESFNP